MFRTAFARSLGIGLVAILAAPLVCARFAWAQDPPPARIRGTIERVDGATYVVKARDSAELKLSLVDNAQIAGIIKASLSDIKQNSFVGVTAMPQPDGSLNAVEVHIFPEAMRGRRRTLSMGSATAEHDDQCQCRAGRQCGGRENVDVEIQGRRKEDRRAGECANRRLRARRQKRHQAGGEGLHRRGQTGRRNAPGPGLAGRPGRCDAADAIAQA